MGALFLNLMVVEGAAATTSSTGSTLVSERGSTGLHVPAGVALASSDPFTGAATHRYPIAVPPGTGGMQPELELRYSSQASAVSWVGVGWGLSLGRIERSLRFGVPAYRNADDHFEFDGELLVRESQSPDPVPGAPVSYDTRRRSGRRIRHLPDDSWEVTAADGTIARYGTTAASRLTNPHASAGEWPTFAWALSEVVDARGNGLVVAYDGSDPGVLYPVEVRYTYRADPQTGALVSVDPQDPNGVDRVVQLLLEPRPDPNLSFRAGFERELAKRLARITTSVAGERLREIDLVYAQSGDSGRSLLIELHERGRDVPDPPPARVTRFEYSNNDHLQGAAAAWQLSGDWVLPGGLRFVDGEGRDAGTRLADLNGDALVDLAHSLWYSDSGAHSSGVYLNRHGFAVAPSGLCAVGAGSGFCPAPSARWQVPTDGFVQFAVHSQSGGWTRSGGTLLLDLNGDGRADLHTRHGAWVLDFVGAPIWPGDPLEAVLNLFLLYGPNTGAGAHGFDAAFPYFFSAPNPSLDLAAERARDQDFSVDGNAVVVELDGDGCPDVLARDALTRRNGGPAGTFVYEAPVNFYRLGDCSRSGYDGMPWGGAATDRFQLCALDDPDPVARTVCALEAAITRRELYETDSEIRFGDTLRAGKRYVDLNGDGLDDHVTAFSTQDSGVGQVDWWNVYLNDGRDFARDDRFVLPVLLDVQGVDGITRDQGVRVVDLNGDGQLDLVQALGSTRAAWLGATDYRAATSDLWRAQAADSPWQLPPGVDLVGVDGSDAGVRLVDLDGDGLVDLLQANASSQLAYSNRGRVPDLLTRVTSPEAGEVRFEYEASTRYDNTGGDGLGDLPNVLQVVAAIEIDDARGGVMRSDFDYAGGRYDVATRELRGFARVTASRPDGSRIATSFYQDAARYGLVESIREEDAAGNPWRIRRHLYGPDVDPPVGASGPFWTLLELTEVDEHDGTGPPRRTRSAFVYDLGEESPVGNLLSSIEYGAVDVASGADLDTADTRSTVYEYAARNDARFIVDRVTRRQLVRGLPGSTDLTRETRFFYDGDLTGTAAAVRGELTRRVEVLAQPGEPDPTTTFTYDVYGNLARVDDARTHAGDGGSAEVYEFDPVFHTFRTAVTLLGTPVPQRREFSLASSAACPVQHPTAAGLVHEERGPNQLATPGSRWLRCYDAFGRLEVEERYHAGALVVRTRFEHPDPLTQVRRELADAAGGERVVEMRADATGRPRERLETGPGARTVRTAWHYDAAGRVSALDAPHFEGEEFQSSLFAYDPLGRTVATTLPGGRVTSVARDRGVETWLDPEGNSVTRRVDPFGRVREIEREGALTRYEYDVDSSLMRIEDAAGNTTTLAYDAIGRRTELSDPDTGLTRFRYDANGNLVERREAVGTPAEIEIAWSFDALDRPLERSVAGATDGTWSYDVAAGGIGRLASRDDGAGRFVAVAYDAIGELASERHELDGRVFDFSTTRTPRGELASITYPGGERLAFVRDAAGYVTGLETASRVLVSAIDRDAQGRLASWTAGNGVATSHTFDSLTGRLERLQVDAPTTPLEDRVYGYDLADRVTSVQDQLDASRARTFQYDPRGRLVAAAGPWGTGGQTAPLAYAYDAIGNLLCKAASSLAGCADGLELGYPGPGSPRPHAPTSVGGLAATYTDAGNLETLGAREYTYDALGHLAAASEAGKPLVAYAYDASGRRVRETDFGGPLPRTRLRPRRDFEWDSTSALARVHVELDGVRVATLVRSVSLEIGVAGPASGSGGRPRIAASPAQLELVVGALALGALGLVLLRSASRRRRPVLAGAAACALLVTSVPEALAIPDGDLNRDARLDAADALLALRFARGELVPDADDLASGDLAPLELAPESPSDLNVADALLILRATRGEDVDRDGLSTRVELEAGASPFRADTDRDGLPDPEELMHATDPAQADSDGDGLPDGTEVASGSDPLSPDSDGDGFVDGLDPDPLEGEIYRHADHAGSTILITRADASVLTRVSYRPYGELTTQPPPSSSGSPQFGFTGQEHASTLGLHDFGARFYDPVLGRFLQPDRAVPDPLDPQSLNRYAYVRNDPVGRVDPTGRFDLFSSLLGAAGAVKSIVSPVLRVAWTAASSGLALGAAVAVGVPTDLLSVAGVLGSDENAAYRRYDAWATEEGGPDGGPATSARIGGVASGVVTRSAGFTADMIEFALIDNIGNNFPAFGRWAARGGYGDAARVTDYLRSRIREAGEGPLRVGCGSQGCARASFSFEVLLQELGPGPLSNVTLDAYGAATRFSDELRDAIDIESYAHPGDVWVSGVYGEYLTSASSPPSPRYVPLPNRSHQFRTYCGALGTCP